MLVNMKMKRSGNIHYISNTYDEKKQSLVFFHGFPDNGFVWNKLISKLEEDYNCLVLHAPGCLESEEVKLEDFDLMALGLSYLDIIRSEFGERSLTLICHDMGGGYAHEVLKLLPKSTRIVCINTIPGELFLNREQVGLQIVKSSYMLLFQIPLHRVKLVKKSWKFLRKKMQNLGGSRSEFPIEYNENIMNGVFFYHVLRKNILKFREKYLYKNSTLYIWGELDPFLVKVTESELQNFYEKHQVKYTDLGHWPMLDNPKLVADEIKKFIKG